MYSITITPSANSECLICMDILLNAPDFNKIGTSKQRVLSVLHVVINCIV